MGRGRSRSEPADLEATATSGGAAKRLSWKFVWKGDHLIYVCPECGARTTGGADERSCW